MKIKADKYFTFNISILTELEFKGNQYILNWQNVDNNKLSLVNNLPEFILDCANYKNFRNKDNIKHMIEVHNLSELELFALHNAIEDNKKLALNLLKDYVNGMVN